MGKKFLSSPKPLTGFEALASYQVGNGGFFPIVKGPGREADH